MLLTGNATPEAIRPMGEPKLPRWLRQRRVRGYANVAARVVAAARTQHTVLAGQDVTVCIVSEFAGTLFARHERLKVEVRQNTTGNGRRSDEHYRPRT